MAAALNPRERNKLFPPSSSPTASDRSSSLSSGCDFSSESCPSEASVKPRLSLSRLEREREVSPAEEPKPNTIRRLFDPWLKPRRAPENSSCHVSPSSRWVLGEETKQSLLRLTWKKGFPLLTFSLNETDILAATRKAGGEASYTFFYVQEEKMKKKAGIWLSPGKSGKRKELVSNMAGQLSVSFSKEFVLVGGEGESYELAGVAVEREGRREKAAVVLPKERHGMSNEEGGGRPTPLLERWRNGGACDCGGWDVGCSLTVLVNRPQDGDHRVELFFQGGSRNGKRGLSLVVYKEGVYTVDFHASIGPLQAFAACVSLLHSRSSTGLRALRKPQQ